MRDMHTMLTPQQREAAIESFLDGMEYEPLDAQSRPLTPTEEELLAETETTCLMIEEHIAEPAREQDLMWPSVVVF